MKDENGNLMADTSEVFSRWNHNLRHILNVHEGSELGEGIEIHTAELQVPESISEIKETIRKYKNPTSLGIDSILEEFIKGGGEKLTIEIHK